MIAIAVDDESWALKMLTQAVLDSGCAQSVQSFSACTAALEWAQKNPFDIAFLDINMRGIGGMELAKRLRKINPESLILFCTGYQEYALEAFRMHADGYLLKPVSAEQIAKEIAYLTRNSTKSGMVQIRCFGGFDVLDAKGNVLKFKRKKTKELLAILVDRRGMGITAKEICSILWEGDAEQDKKNMQYLWNLFSDLTKTLKDADAESIVAHNGMDYSLDTSVVKCDLYDFIKGAKTGIDPESYMPQYSWAESTVAYLVTL